MSQEAYHEITQQEPKLPKSYLVEACQRSLDDEWNITRTPGECLGFEKLRSRYTYSVNRNLKLTINISTYSHDGNKVNLHFHLGGDYKVVSR